MPPDRSASFAHPPLQSAHLNLSGPQEQYSLFVLPNASSSTVPQSAWTTGGAEPFVDLAQTDAEAPLPDYSAVQESLLTERMAREVAEQMHMARLSASTSFPLASPTANSNAFPGHLATLEARIAQTALDPSALASALDDEVTSNLAALEVAKSDTEFNSDTDLDASPRKKSAKPKISTPRILAPPVALTTPISARGCVRYKEKPSPASPAPRAVTPASAPAASPLTKNQSLQGLGVAPAAAAETVAASGGGRGSEGSSPPGDEPSVRRVGLAEGKTKDSVVAASVESQELNRPRSDERIGTTSPRRHLIMIITTTTTSTTSTTTNNQ
jgi:hypothetical protein